MGKFLGIQSCVILPGFMRQPCKKGEKRVSPRLSVRLTRGDGIDGFMMRRLYQSQASTMPMKSAHFSEAPPMRPPSTSGLEKRALALEGLQLPP